MKKSALLLTTALFITACAQHDTAPPATAPTPPPTAVQPAFPPFGISLDYIDDSSAPGSDFFKHSNGGWMKTAEIPASRSYAGVNLELDTSNEKRLKDIVAGLRAKPDGELTSEERKLRDLYNAFVDQAKIDRDGLHVTTPDLDAIYALKTKDDVASAMADPSLSLDGPFGMYLGVDQKHPDTYSINLGQSGLGMPDRDYYLKTDKEIVQAQAAYKKYIAEMLLYSRETISEVVIPNTEYQRRADAVYKLELEIAKASWAADERRDDEKTYNPMSLSALKKLAPAFPWNAYFQSAGIPLTGKKGERTVIVAENTAFPKLSAVFARTPVAVWRDYLVVRYFHAFADYLPKAIDDADFAFYSGSLSGQTQQLDRETRGAHMLDNTMGEALGKLYVAKYFSPEAKVKVRTLVDNMLKAYAEDIKTLDWMSPETRAKALDKLSKFTPKVGYPDTWRDYSALEIPSGNLVQAIKNTEVFNWKRQVTRLDEPVDKTEWDMTPPTNNAYYNPVFNEIVFPAGILQPPYFDPNADDAVNYGEAGATIGHEISHGFDDQGSKYDGDGVLRNWWTEADRKNFDARTTMLAKQYDQYQPLPGLHVNGRLTLGENIADLAGLVIAYKAYHISLHGQPAPVLNGLTGDQRFYLAYGQSWREIWRDGRTRQVVLSNPHSPPLYRVNGVVRNDDAWYAAFPDVKPGDTYYLSPDQRVHLW